MNDYKDTLNLPQTDFPMKANLAQREPEILKKWEEIHLYQTLRQERQGKKKFILHLGPPYANGHIHLGTATTTLLKDIIVKSKSMSGFDAPLVPGWDCHGLPIELNVEKKLGKPGRNVSLTEFRKACRAFATSFIDIQRNEFKRLGIVADFDHPYLTMDFKYEANIIRSLAKIIKNNHLQKGYKPVHWCLDCASALAEAEVEYQEKKSHSIDVRFRVVDQAECLRRFEKVTKADGEMSIPIWTTTPWSLPANEAVALNQKVEYALVATPTEQLIIASDLVATVMARYGVSDYHILGNVLGEQLEGVSLQHPFYEKIVPVILGDHVTIETGTGAVHTSPAHGLDDYLVAKKYQLPLINPVGDDGCYTADTLLVAGQHVRKVNEFILQLLKDKNNLIHEESLIHSFPHCWRHKTPLIFRATPQWFISMDQNNLRTLALNAIDQVEWIPEWGKSRIHGMIANRPDWCISRQRTWGVPLALFLHKETGALHPETLRLMEEVALAVEQEGIEAWFSLDEKTLLGNSAKDYKKTMDVLDVWFDSGVSHECVLKARKDLAFPADIVLEGSDQHRGWFQSSLLTSVAINNTASYREVLTHGFVVDGQGRKMSKSLGNVIAPEEVIQTLGADVLRLWVASIDYRYEINASKEILSRMSETYRRIRNTARFLLANLNGYDNEKNCVSPDEMLMLDRWILEKCKQLQNDITEAYETYQFHVVVQKLQQFCVNDLGGFYLDIIKDRQYTMPTNSRGRRSAQTALFHIAHAMVRWMAPILSFTAEEIWRYLPHEDQDSVMLTTWYDQFPKIIADPSFNSSFWETIQQVRNAVYKEIENMRQSGELGSQLEAEVTLYCDHDLKKQLDLIQDELRFVLITSYTEVREDHKEENLVMTEVPGLRLHIHATSNEKCARCWHRCSDVNQNKDYPGLCGRCIDNIFGEGEIRKYA